jgi:hypothetical protein
MNLLEGRKSAISYSGLLQVDLDCLGDYDIELLKKEIFKLSFCAFVGRSCSGLGLYAFLKIAEPERLQDYTDHIFKVFQDYELPIDSSKGRNYNDLRYVSYDSKMLLREYPGELKIPAKPKNYIPRKYSPVADDGRQLLEKISSAQPGERFNKVRKYSFVAGGLGIPYGHVEKAILSAPQMGNDFLKTARRAYEAGQIKFQR